MLANLLDLYIKNITMQEVENLKDKITNVCNAKMSGIVLTLHILATRSNLKDGFDPVWFAERLIRWKYEDGEG